MASTVLNKKGIEYSIVKIWVIGYTDQLNISRNEYATQKLYSRMKIMTTMRIFNLAEDVELALKRKKSIQAAFIDESAKILSQRCGDERP